MKAIYGSLICLLFVTHNYAHGIQPDSSGKGSTKGKVEYGWKVEAGESFSTMSVSDLSARTTITPKLSFLGGVSFVADDFRIGRFVISAQYQQAGMHVSTKDVAASSGNVSLHYLKIPFQYQFYISRSKRLFAGGGGYIAALVSHSSEQFSLNYEEIKNHDAGAILTIGFRLTPRFILEGGVQKGLVNIDVSEARRTSRNGMAILMLSYTLGSSSSGHIKQAKLTCRKAGGTQDY